MRLYFNILIPLLILAMALVTACTRSAEEKKAEIIALQFKGALLIRKQAFEEAISVYNQAIKLNPQNLATYAGRGQAYLGLQRIEKAKADFQRVIEQADTLVAQDPKLSDVLANSYYHLALIALTENKPEVALDSLEQSLRLANNPNVYFHELRDSSAWAMVRQEPRFRALMEQYWPVQRPQTGANAKPVYPKPPSPPGL